MKEKETTQPRMPKLWEALLTMLFLVAMLAIGIIKYEVDPQVPMFVGVIGAALMAMHLGYKWKDIEDAMLNGIFKALQSVIILAIIGILTGVWLDAGVVPTMIYYGLKVLHPSIFFVGALLICSITALATGTSWGTMGTMGVALMGIGVAQYAPWAIFNWLMPIMTIVLAYLGVTVADSNGVRFIKKKKLAKKETTWEE